MSGGLPAPSASEQAELLDWWTQRVSASSALPVSAPALLASGAAGFGTALVAGALGAREPAWEILALGLGPLAVAWPIALRRLRPPLLELGAAGAGALVGLVKSAHDYASADPTSVVALGAVVGTYTAALLALLFEQPARPVVPERVPGVRAALARPDGPEVVLLLFAADTPDGGRTLARFDLWPDRGQLACEYTPYTPTYLGGSGPVWSARVLEPGEAGRLHRLASDALPPVPRPTRQVRPCLLQVLRRDLPASEVTIDLGARGHEPADGPVSALVRAAVDAARRTAWEGS